MSGEEPRFFHPHGEIHKTLNHLPHWQQTAATYFVTFRLADSVPFELQKDWNERRELWCKHHPKPWSEEVEEEYHRLFSRQYEDWLDQGLGECVLREPQNADFLQGAFLHFNNERYEIFASVIMPNHAHVLFSLSAEFTLEQTLHTWKLFSARQINLRAGKAGRLW